MKNLLRFLMMLMAVVIIGNPSVALASYEEGLKAALRGDFVTARNIWEPMAAKGNAPAQSGLGNLYYRGLGVIQNYEKAIDWYRKAVKQKETAAQFSLGYMYYGGLGVPQDFQEAIKWYSHAAIKRHRSSLNNLGYMYSQGLGVPADKVTAHMWYNIAASFGDRVALKNRQKIERQLAPSQLTDAHNKARAWLAKYQN